MTHCTVNSFARNAKGDGCLLAVDCESKLRYACEAAFIDFDSITFKVHEGAFKGRGWEVVDGRTKKSLDGPFVDHTLGPRMGKQKWTTEDFAR